MAQPDGGSESRLRSTKRTERLITLVVGGVAVVLVALGAWFVLTPEPAHTGPTDMDGNPVGLEPDTALSDQLVLEMGAVEDAGLRFRAPSVELDVPLGELSMAGNTITPPGFTSAYRVRNLGVPLDEAADGTVYVVMHSLRGGGLGPGNYLIDVERQTARIQPGEEIVVGEATYTVTGDLTVAKDDLQHETAIWDDVPGRLVVITCQQRPDGKAAIDNVILTAQLSPGV